MEEKEKGWKRREIERHLEAGKTISEIRDFTGFNRSYIGDTKKLWERAQKEAKAND